MNTKFWSKYIINHSIFTIFNIYFTNFNIINNIFMDVYQ